MLIPQERGCSRSNDVLLEGIEAMGPSSIEGQGSGRVHQRRWVDRAPGRPAQAGWSQPGLAVERLEARSLLSSSGLLSTASSQSAADSVAYLKRVMDREHTRFGVYEDVSSPGNHF